MNYPCIIKHAPRKTYNGHSSHVMKVRFYSNGRNVVTVGGNDATVILWDIIVSNNNNNNNILNNSNNNEIEIRNNSPNRKSNITKGLIKPQRTMKSYENSLG